jgi:hypothetical protein
MKRFLAYMSFQELERHQPALQRVYILFGEQWVKSESETHPTGLVVPASGMNQYKQLRIREFKGHAAQSKGTPYIPVNPLWKPFLFRHTVTRPP